MKQIRVHGMGVALLCYYLGKIKSKECDKTARLFYDELWKGSYNGCAEGVVRYVWWHGGVISANFVQLRYRNVPMLSDFLFFTLPTRFRVEYHRAISLLTHIHLYSILRQVQLPLCC